jgi:hypothetical protein
MYMDSELDTEMLLRGAQTFTPAVQREGGCDAVKSDQPDSHSIADLVTHSIGANNLLKGGNGLLLFLRIIGACVILSSACVAVHMYDETRLLLHKHWGAESVAQFLVLDGMLFLSIQSVLPALYFNYFRLLERATSEEADVVQECCKVAATFGAVSGTSLLVALVVTFTFFLDDTPILGVELTGIILFNAAVVAALMISIVLLLLDVKVSHRMLDQLHTLADGKALTMDRFCAARDEIHRRVAASRFSCDYVLAPALASVVGIVAAILIVSQYYAPWTALLYCSFMMVQLKELFYVAVAFAYVARVNARADELTSKLSVGMWGHYNQIGSASAGALPDPELQLSTVSDMHRVSIYMSAKENPISFTLMFTRLSWRSVIASAVALVLSLLIGTIRSIVISQVT